jgi:hypothetical protein
MNMACSAALLALREYKKSAAIQPGAAQITP